MSRLFRAATAALALAAFSPAAHAADPTGSWKFDPKSLEALANSMADRMAAEVTPEQQSLQAEALKDLEARQQEMQKSDPAAAQQMADRLKEARDQDAAMRADPKGYFRQSFMAGLQTLEKVRLRLEPGGKVVVEGAESGGEGDSGEGTWKLDGDKIEIAAAMPDEEGQGQPERMTGTFTGDRMELRPVETPPDEAAPGEEGSDNSAADEDKNWARPRKATRRRTRRRRSPSRSCPGCWCAPTTRARPPAAVGPRAGRHSVPVTVAISGTLIISKVLFGSST